MSTYKCESGSLPHTLSNNSNLSKTELQQLKSIILLEENEGMCKAEQETMGGTNKLVFNLN